MYQYTTKDIGRFWSKVKLPDVIGGADQCWEWQASKNNGGYGTFRIGKIIVKAHRMAYQLSFETIPHGLAVLHKCDNPKCCNPTHLFLGTAADNIRDMDNKGRRGTAKGERHGRRKHPEKFAHMQGEGHWMHRHPEWKLPPERLVRGEDVITAKLSKADVREIRDMYATGQYSQKEISERFKIHQSQVSKIVRRKQWRL